MTNQTYRVTYATGVSWISSARTLLGAKREATKNLSLNGGEISIQDLAKIDIDGDNVEVARYNGRTW